MTTRFTVIEGGRTRQHRREQRVLERCRRLGYLVEKLLTAEGSPSQFSVTYRDAAVGLFGLGQLEHAIKWEERRRAGKLYEEEA
jgi:hypothetical protein